MAPSCEPLQGPWCLSVTRSSGMWRDFAHTWKTQTPSCFVDCGAQDCSVSANCLRQPLPCETPDRLFRLEYVASNFNIDAMQSILFHKIELQLLSWYSLQVRSHVAPCFDVATLGLTKLTVATIQTWPGTWTTQHNTPFKCRQLLMIKM